MHKGRSIRRWIGGGVAVLVAVGVAGVVIVGQRPAGAKAAPDARAAQGAAGAASAPPLEFRTTEVVQPSRVAMTRRIEFSGPLVAPHTAVIRSKAAGTLLALQAVEGQRVAAGQVLGRIDLAELSSRVAERGAQLESARATLAQAERTHASNERLAAQSFISPIALENSRAQLDTARAALAAAQASLETTRVGLREAALVAPIAGIVARRHVLPGEKVSVEQPVVTLVDLRQLELAGSVGTHEVSALAPGMVVQVRPEGSAAPVAGRLARIAPAAEPGTRAIGVIVTLDNPRETMRAGQYALAQVELADAQPRLTLPLPAVGSSSGQDHVWVIEGGLLARRAVTLGRRDDAGGRVEVLGGVNETSTVLAARFDNLREGARAKIAPSTGAPGGAARVASSTASAPAAQ